MAICASCSLHNPYWFLLQQDAFAGVVLLAPLLSMQRTAGAWVRPWWRVALPLLDRIWPTLPLGVSVHSSKQPELMRDMLAGECALLVLLSRWAWLRCPRL